MAERKVTFIVGANIKNFTKGIDKVTRKFKRFGHQMEDIGSTLTASVSAPLAALGGISIKTAADYETLRQSMDVLNGSAEEGARNFERLKRFSAETPFQLQDLAEAQNMLQGFGLSADDAFQSLSMIGDIAAIAGGDIKGIGIAFGQAAAEGRLMSRDIRQLINQGVPAIKLLADTMGVAESEVLDLASQGKISFDILQQSFRDATSEGGMFADGMSKQANTLNGLFSTLKDNVSIALGELGNTIVDTFNLREVVRNLTKSIQLITEKFQGLSEDSKKEILKVAGLLAASGPLAFAIGKIAKLVVLLSNVVRSSFFKMVAPVVAFIAALKATADILAKYQPQFKAALLVGAEKAKQSIKDLTSVMGDWMLDAFGVKDALNELSVALNSGENAIESYKQSAVSVSGALGGVSTTSIAPAGGIGGAGMLSTNRLEELSRGLLRNVQITESLKNKVKDVSRASEVAMEISTTFTNSFGAGMANVIVQGEKLVDTLRNIGKLLVSSAIQKGIGLLLTGGLSGGGFFGSGGGLFGKIFGVNDALVTSGGDVVKFHPDDNILAMKDFGKLGGGQKVHVTVSGQIQGDTIYLSGERAQDRFNR